MQHVIVPLISFSAEAIPLEKSTVWATHGKTFDTWICPLVYSLIGLCNDVILRYYCWLPILIKSSLIHNYICCLSVKLVSFHFGETSLLDWLFSPLLFSGSFQIMSRYCVDESWSCWAFIGKYYCQSCWKEGYGCWSLQVDLFAGCIFIQFLSIYSHIYDRTSSFWVWHFVLSVMCTVEPIGSFRWLQSFIFGRLSTLGDWLLKRLSSEKNVFKQALWCCDVSNFQFTVYEVNFRL